VQARAGEVNEKSRWKSPVRKSDVDGVGNGTRSESNRVNRGVSLSFRSCSKDVHLTIEGLAAVREGDPGTGASLIYATAAWANHGTLLLSLFVYESETCRLSEPSGLPVGIAQQRAMILTRRG
jgi:hypothetical protein